MVATISTIRTFAAALVAATSIATGQAGNGAEFTSAQEEAASILSKDVRGGLVVHVGCGNGKFSATLRASNRCLVHGLDADEANGLASIPMSLR